jgi:hypothetical protein
MFLLIFNKSSAQIYPAPILRLFRGFTLIWQRHRPFWKLVQGAPARLRRESNGKYFSACSANSAIKTYIKIEPQKTQIHSRANWKLCLGKSEDKILDSCWSLSRTSMRDRNDSSVNSVPSVVKNLWYKTKEEEK